MSASSRPEALPAPVGSPDSASAPVPTGGAGLVDIASPYPAQRIGEILVSLGALDRRDLLVALSRQANETGPPLGAMLVDQGLVSRNDLEAGLALQRGVWRAPLDAGSPDLALVDAAGPDFCLRHGLIPWRRQGARTVVATARPDEFEAARPALEAALGPVRMAIAEERAIVRTLVAHRGPALARLAEARTPEDLSVRAFPPAAMALAVAAVIAAAFTALTLAPAATLATLLLASAGALGLMTALKAAALICRFRPGNDAPPPALADADLPRITVLVPLLSESAVTEHLIGHLSALEYPTAKLDVLLVTETGDLATAATLGHNRIPSHFRQVTVPEGTIRTKPRALNYALDFARGDVIGVYDAEDAPEPDQLRRVAAAFAHAPENVVCLQGRLDFYNADQNWLSRCFALDYAAWFRIVLPGLAAMGFAIPLGGTTLFFRRPALEALGRWDAHNVTEDADLGIRIARRGWRTAMVGTTTYEEANCHALPWIRQRTRWLKGYALTWAVHMRRPVRLWRELGSKRFLGFNLMFLGTVLLFLAAPLFWTLWVLPFGIGHPAATALSRPVLLGLTGLFLGSELVNLALGAVAVATRRDRWLVKWAPTLAFYFPLAALAAWRALIDIAVAPFYWDKTRHGLSRQAISPAASPARSDAGAIRTRD